jgi:hypothetical protein
VTHPCPDSRELLELLDGEVTENRAGTLRAHLSGCARCTALAAEQRLLVERIGAPIPGLAAAAAVAEVMARLPAGGMAPPGRRRFTRWPFAAGGVAAAAAALVVVVGVLPPGGEDRGQFAARGAQVEWARKVGVELWALEGSPRRIEAGGVMGSSTAVVASFTNVDVAAAWLLAFAVDARGELHWLYPAFIDPSTDPEAVRLDPSGREQPLPDAVAFDDLPVGPLRFVTLVTRAPLRVGDIERLRPEELRPEALRSRWPGARIDEIPFIIALPVNGSAARTP